MTGRDVDRLVQDASIIRNRGKIQATVDRQRARDDVRVAEPRCAREILRGHPQAGTAVRRRPAQVDPAGGVREAVEVAGYRFVGPTSLYAFMKNIGVVNDHVHGCFRATDYPPRP